MSSEPIRILVVDDTVTYRKIVSDILAAVPGVQVVGTAPNGKIALQKIDDLRPDLLTLDLEMPEVDGLEVLRRLKSSGSSAAAIMLSAFTDTGAMATMEALNLGAFDFVPKPTGSTPQESIAALRDSLCPKIEAFAKTRRIHNILHDKTGAVRAAGFSLREVAQSRVVRVSVVALGISTGGPQALAAMMPNLPGYLAAPLLIVQHMPSMFTKSLADSLNEKCALDVREAQDGEPVEAGCALIAPGGKQMRVNRAAGNTTIQITDDPPENSCRPSVDYLFRSVSQVYGSNALGVIMTGMGSDGALGCRLMKRKGATILTQDEGSCVVYGMPQSPADEGLADVVVPLDRIAAEIVRLAGRRTALCR